MKKVIAFLLVLCMVLAMCACGGGPSYGVNVVQTLVEQDYSLAFRVNDPLYFYVTAALSVLAAQGRVDALAIKWLGSPALNFEKQADALELLQAYAGIRMEHEDAMDQMERHDGFLNVR